MTVVAGLDAPGCGCDAAQGLASIDVNAIQEAYFARLEAASGASLSLRKSPLRSAEN